MVSGNAGHPCCDLIRGDRKADASAKVLTVPIRKVGGTPVDIKRTLNRVSNMVLNGEMDAKDANVVIDACNTTLTTIHIDELE